MDEIVGCYASREEVILALGAQGSLAPNPTVDLYLKGTCRRIDRATQRKFLPYYDQKFFRWPQSDVGPGYAWYLDLDYDDLLSVSQLLTSTYSENGVILSSVTMDPTQYYLEPQQWGPPFNRIEMNLNNSQAFASGYTIQRAIYVQGLFGWRFHQEDITTLTADITSTTAPVISITAVPSTELGTWEVIQIDQEFMWIRNIDGGTLTVQRGINGSTAATHTNGTTVYLLAASDDIKQAAVDWTTYAIGPALTGITPDVQMLEVPGDLVIKRFNAPPITAAEEANDVYPLGVKQVIDTYRRRRMLAA